MPNPYTLQENDPYSFEFVTDQGIRCLVYFLDYHNLFAEYPNIAKQIYMFSLEAIQGDPDEGTSDERIGITLLRIFSLFFKERQNVAVYVCDSVDNRQLARKRKFDSWFWKYNDGSLLKEDDIAVIEGTEIYNSMILHKENEHLKEIILAFKELNEKANDK